VSEPTAPPLSELLRTFRIRAGLTQSALAEMAGLSEQAISVLERGTRSRPRADTIQSLTQALDLGPADADLFRAVARGKSRSTGSSAPAEPQAVPDRYPMPWQLPPAAADFTGRDAQMDAILGVLRAPTEDGNSAVGLVAVTGMGGIGKTTLAVQAAHKLSGSYPDGHLYLNLRGYGPGDPMATADALRHLLRSLGVDAQLIPDNVEESTALLRSQLAGRRVLMVLDNAADADHVLPLLPGRAGSAAIVTSRGSLLNLPGARQIRLDALSESESLELLTEVIGPARVAAEPAAAEVLATFSGRLPLAVRLIGGRLATRPTWPIQHFVDLLHDEERRLDSLGSDETGVRASIASSVRFLQTSDRDLDRRAAQALPVLSIPDGSDLLSAVVAALLEVSVRQADAILERLVDLNLLESVAPARYRLHDLIRAYGREIADQTMTAGQRDQALDRIVRFYTAVAWAGQSFTHSTSPRLPLATIRHDDAAFFRHREEVLRWLDSEQRNLMDRVRQAKRSSLANNPLFAELALALFGYHEARRRWPEMRELGDHAIAVAESHDLKQVAAWLRHDRAIPEAESADAATAVDWIRTALAIFREIGDLPGQARCCSSLAYLLGLLDRIEEALEYCEEALDLSRRIGDATLEGVSLTALGVLYDRSGDFARADEAFSRGIELAERLGETRSVVKRYLNAGFAHLQSGRYEDAVRLGLKGLRIAEPTGDAVFRTESHHMLSLAFAVQGDYESALAHIHAALPLTRMSRDTLREGRLYTELAKIEAARRQRSEAIEHLNTAISLLENTSVVPEADARDLLERLRRGELPDYVVTKHPV
jgi:tetratricopeptide (TPR) repeat protein/transcriptional regulator with XRE-family HTH domain